MTIKFPPTDLVILIGPKGAVGSVNARRNREPADMIDRIAKDSGWDRTVFYTGNNKILVIRTDAAIGFEGEIAKTTVRVVNWIASMATTPDVADAIRTIGLSI